MDSYCVIGHPIAHSRSPWIHARFAELTGQAIVYERRLAPLDGFAADLAAFRAAGGRGCNVTLPFKFEALALAQAPTARARLAQACNTLRFDDDGVHADNTDGVGLVRDITVNAATAIAGRDLLLVGAGGAAAGVLGPLLEERPRRLVVCNRTASRAQALVERHAALAQACACELRALPAQALATPFDIVINGTASSLAGAAVPVPRAVVGPGTLACDMMYGAAAQPFLSWAQAGGGSGRDGLGMLVEQAAESFWFWRGVRPPGPRVLQELRAVLAAEAARAAATASAKGGT